MKQEGDDPKREAFERGVEKLCKFEGDILALRFKELVETKHLYQNLRIEARLKEGIDLYVAKMSNASSDLHFVTEKVAERVQEILSQPWELRPSINKNPFENTIYSDLVTSKLFCRVCGRIEAFHALSTWDTISRVEWPLPHAERERPWQHPPVIQNFVIVLQCQSCKGKPEVFLVRREDFKLTISGRSPIEFVMLPDMIPKETGEYYSGAALAYDSGQTLAALFLLRTFIEQYVRRKTGMKQDREIDQVFEAYMTTLPDDFKGRFPSLPALYESLSAALHAADASEDIFVKCRDDVDHHFEARKAFRLS